MGIMGAQTGQTEPAARSGQISSLESVALEVRNPDIARHFYTEVLGLRLLSGGDTEESRGPILVQPADGGSTLMLCRVFESSSRFVHEPVARPPLRWTGLRLATDNIDAMYETLRAHNVRFLQEPQSKPWGVRDCVFCDPDGNVFSLVQQLPA